MTEIARQTYDVTNPFNEALAIGALQNELSSKIFKELIEQEKSKIRITFILEVEER